MIIKYPTGLYTSVLPSAANEAGNVTFTISNSLPPRSDLLVPKVPIGIVQRKRLSSATSNRSSLGDLIFSVSKSQRVVEGNSSRQYEIGQIIEFNEQNGKTVDPMLVSISTEVRHDTNKLDYELMGLTDSERQVVEGTSTTVQESISSKLNEYRQLRSNTEQIINNNQKLINELNRTIESLEIAMNYSTGTEENDSLQRLIDKLKTKQNQAFIDRDDAITLANSYAQESARLVDELRSVGYLVK